MFLFKLSCLPSVWSISYLYVAVAVCIFFSSAIYYTSYLFYFYISFHLYLLSLNLAGLTESCYLVIVQSIKQLNCVYPWRKGTFEYNSLLCQGIRTTAFSNEGMCEWKNEWLSLWAHEPMGDITGCCKYWIEYMWNYANEFARTLLQTNDASNIEDCQEQ